MFSTSTIASSTSSPTATARPPSVMVLTVRPKAWNTSAVMRIDSGMAVRVMTLVRTFHRNTNSTTNTQTLPSRLARPALHHPAAGEHVRLLGRVGQLLQRHVLGGEPVRRRDDLVLL